MVGIRARLRCRFHEDAGRAAGMLDSHFAIGGRQGVEVTTGKFIEASPGTPCAVCKATKRCSATEDGQKLFCYRVSKDCLQAKTDCQGVAYWIHKGPNYVE